MPEEIGHLRNLSSISIVSKKLSGMLPSSFYNISSLVTISAAGNQFNGSLPSNMFVSLPNLRLFGIGLNKMSGPIPTSIVNASQLQLFDIPKNNFVGQVSTNLGNLKDLWWLEIGEKNLGSNSANDLEFLTSLTNNSKLELLDFSFNNFGGALPNSIANLSIQLNQFYLGDNRISGTIPAGLESLINLIALGMNNNNFTGTLPTTFGRFQKMQVLTLSGNKLSGQIPSSIGNLSQLFQLSLSKNMLEGSIPPSIGSCQNLQYLDISQNNLSGAIPSQVIGLSSLSILLNLSQNSFNGSLPVEVGKLKSITALDVSENELSGEIPGTIGECIILEYLNLQGNSFQGTIPSSLISLKGLRRLDLSRNNLTGKIPDGLQDISVLEYLNLSFNMLDGEVPAEGLFQNASAVSLDGNHKLCGGVSDHSCHLLDENGKKKNKKSSSTSSPTDRLSQVTYQSLHQATNGFSLSNLIGSGSFGFVYNGTLEPEERVVAIKVLNLQRKGAHKSFISECNALRNIRHRNLVKILTCCSSSDYNGNDFKALVFEYMTNGSLEKWLHPEPETEDLPRILDLQQRLNIVADVASAVHYLHDQCEQPFVHCDLKPGNVLLDDDLIAHVSDFGLARLLSTLNGMSQNQTSTSGIKGTTGYAPPVESPKERMNMWHVARELNLIKDAFLADGINGEEERPQTSQFRGGN
ncbi:putative Receptor-kinase [Quillaja saponaria]|uniref:non-specific serine/threonine protein kinase n=1 Tax=Quillaja saponaria TaxID=32244 RepID=A0AAD7PF48_QUISA|nr:putative Receptor-kinase [Quillaja saponaria]